MQARWSISLAAVGAALAFACGGDAESGLGNSSGGSSGSGGSAGSATGGASGSGTGGTATGGSAGAATGGSAGAATGGSAGAATGGSAGAGPVTCADLESAYAKALDAAKLCANGPDPVQPCSELVPNELACPCETFVNPGNTEAVKTLHDLQDQWTKQDCGKNIACPEIACPVPASAICSSSGGKGSHCVDVSVGTGN
jgi:hypothetical protein